jgi:GST-like protein
LADSIYTPPEVWTHDSENGGRFANINRPTAGAREDRELPVGEHDFQLYSLATPNGVKATLMFEELLEAGHAGAEYDAWTVNIGEGDQFGSGFVDLNPNSKIPTLLDRSGPEPVRIFESGAILMHLAEKFGAFLPTDHTRADVPEKFEYPINRYAMETKRLFDVTDQRLAQSEFLGGKDYTIADMATWPWLSPFVLGNIYGEARTFLSIHEYTHVERWVKQIAERPAARRGRIVNKTWGDEDAPRRERHSAADFDGKAI